MKKLRSIWMTIMIVILTVAMVIGSTSLLTFAAEPQAISITVPSSFEYGKTYTVPADASLTAPDGVSTVGGASLNLNQIGIYTLKVGDTFYNIKCSTKTEYELRVDNNGAAIPTIIQKDGKFNLPTATLYQKTSDDDDFVKSEIAVNVSVDGVDKGLASLKSEVVAEASGTINISYSAKIGMADKTAGKKFVTKDFTVKVQDTFKDNNNPTMNVVNVPTDASINTKVTLPIATTADDFDKNVLVKVTVTKDNVAVKEVILDDDGYAVVKPDGEDIVFDNNKTMSFYPTSEGTYIVTYEAVDDSGKKSSLHDYKIKCSDRTAPTLKNIKDNQIPTTWAKNVYKINPNDANKTIQIDDKTITFPYPEYVDNQDASKIEVMFKIEDTVNNQTVITFNNIYDQAGEGKGSTYTRDKNSPSIGMYGEDKASVKFGTDGFKFDFVKYATNMLGKTTTGKYTVTYKVMDARPNISTKTYDITYEESLTDDKAPKVEVDFDKSYYFVGDEDVEFVIPTPIVSDSKDTRPSISYTIKGDGAETITLKGGEKATLTTDNKLKIKDIDTELTFATGKKLSFELSATDDVGNISAVTTKEISIVKTTDFNNSDLGITSSGTNSGAVANEGETQKTVNFGKFVFNSKANFRDFYGFELSLIDPNGQMCSGLSFETYYSNDKIYVDDITFTPSLEGEYKIVASNFDVSGMRKIASYSINVTKTEGDKDPISGVAIPTTGNVNVAYTLMNPTFEATDIDAGRKYIVRRITNAGRMSLMGIDFTAYTTGTVNFKDGYYLKDNGGFEFISSKIGYDLVVVENATPMFEVQGVMPVTSEKSTDEKKVTLTLPSVVASTDFSNAKIELTIKSPSGNILEVSDLGSDSGKISYDPVTNTHSFSPTEDGEYIVTYNATAGEKSETKPFSIKVGDLVGPSFTVDDHDTNAVINSKTNFKFKVINVTSDEDISKLTFTKRLLKPDGSEAYAISGQGADIAKQIEKDEKVYFDTAGNYTVIYEVKDAVGNPTEYQFTINVSGAGTNSNMSIKVISTILIIVGVLLIAGVILYFIRFRKRKA